MTHNADFDALLDEVEAQYEAFRLHHADVGTLDSPAGFARRFREWIAPTIASVYPPAMKQGDE